MANLDLQSLHKLYEGKAKAVYAIPGTTRLVQRFKDSATAFNGVKYAEIGGKGELNNAIASTVFRFLRSKGIESHYHETLNKRDMLIEKVEIIPLEVVVRNVIAGSLSKRTGLDEGTPLPTGIVEFYYKKDELGDPLLNRDHIFALDLATEAELQDLRQQALAINEHLCSFWKTCDLNLVDFKLEFGRTGGKLLLADEISPDTCRLWTSDNRRMDKDVFRRDLADLAETYTEVLDRLGASFSSYVPVDLADPPEIAG